MKKLLLILVLSVFCVSVLLSSCQKASVDGTVATEQSTGAATASDTASSAADTTAVPVTSVSTTAAPVTVAPKTVFHNTEWDGKSLKVLAIGNSFSVDSMEYLYDIARAEGVEEIILGNLYIGGCTLQVHADNATSGAYAYTYYKNTSGEWKSYSAFSMTNALKDEAWDIVTLQQASGSSGISSTYNNSQIKAIVDAVRKNVSNENVKMAWHMTWAYQKTSTHSEFSKYGNNQQRMYNSIVTSVKNRILPREDFPILIPSGTAIQNARTSYVGDALTRDGYHLNDLGRFISGYMWFFTLTGQTPESLKCSPASLSLEKGDLEMIREAVISAFESPLEVKESTHKTRPEIDLSGYEQIEFEYTMGAYWNPTLSDRYNVLITNESNSPYFIATELFSRETLPVGSIIVLDEGWQYRPDAWKDNSAQSSRPAITSAAVLRVTEEWWGDYQYRAFNIAALGANKNIKNDKTAVSHFRIYVPKGTVIPDISVSFEEKEKVTVDLSLYDEMSFDYTVGAYYNSTDASKYSSLISTASNSPYYIATEIFTKETLPVGAVIILDEGWQYRPEAWRELTKQASRPALTAENTVIVTEEWWGDYTHRAFNLSSTASKTTLTDADACHLRIYLPKSPS